jgi:hypothetical protein
MCCDFLYMFLPKYVFLILIRIQRDMGKNVYWSSCKVAIILVRLQRNLHFLDRFSKNTQVSNLMKIRPVGAVVVVVSLSAVVASLILSSLSPLVFNPIRTLSAS